MMYHLRELLRDLGLVKVILITGLWIIAFGLLVALATNAKFTFAAPASIILIGIGTLITAGIISAD